MGGNKKLEPLMKDPKKMKKLMEDSFAKVDVDGNGVLDHAEFEQVLVQIAKEIGVDSPTREEVDNILDLIDENGDGTISRDEFADLIEKVFQMLESEEMI
jgi:Ca2+-binding EF-hand superfamily protein